MAAAGSGAVTIRDLAGNVYATFVVTGPAAWQTAVETSIPADDRELYVAYNGSGVDAITMYALSCFWYMA
jgi:hypothetical protein